LALSPNDVGIAIAVNDQPGEGNPIDPVATSVGTLGFVETLGVWLISGALGGCASYNGGRLGITRIDADPANQDDRELFT
jgi:hypothetical protein